MDKEAEDELVRRAKEGDLAACAELLRALEGLVRRIAVNLCRASHCWERFEDLISEGQVTLAESVQKFDPDQARLATYAYRSIRGAMTDYLEKEKPQGLAVSRADRERAKKVRRAHDELMRALQRKPTSEEIAQHLTVSVEEVRRALQARERLLSETGEPEVEDMAQLTALPLEKAREIERVRKDIARKGSGRVTAEHVAARLEVSPATVEAALTFLGLHFESLNATKSEEGEETGQELPADGPTLEAQVEQRELAAAVESAIVELPEPERAVIVLRFFEELSVEQIADRLGKPLGTVKSLLFRARRRLGKDPRLQNFADDYGLGGENDA